MPKVVAQSLPPLLAMAMLAALTRCGGDVTQAPGDPADTGVADGGDEGSAPSDGSACQCGEMKSLQCYCQELWCESYDGATSCQNYGVVFLKQGCSGYDFVQIGYETAGYGYVVYVFGASSHVLVAARTTQESPLGPCKKSSYVTAGFPSCDAVPYCTLCGKSSAEYPPCAGVPSG